jgi:hypothetical protein
LSELLPNASLPRWYAEEGTSISINALKRTGDSGGLWPSGAGEGQGWFRPRRLVPAFGMSSAGVERSYALAEAMVIIGKIAVGFPGRGTGLRHVARLAAADPWAVRRRATAA